MIHRAAFYGPRLMLPLGGKRIASETEHKEKHEGQQWKPCALRENGGMLFCAIAEPRHNSQQGTDQPRH